MSESLETLRSLCRCLGRDGGPGTAQSDVQWRQVIELANLHYLTPALWWALEKKGQVKQPPEDAREFLEAALALNRSRNEKIRDQATELMAALTTAGIRSVVLKGGVYLFEDDEAAFNTRMMVDLDVLVPEESLERSANVAETLGYRVLEKSDELFQHIDPLGRPGDLASVEIHRHVGMQRRVLPAEEVLHQAIPLNYDGRTFCVPTPTHRAIHAIFHSEVQAQSNYALGRIPLRYLHDLMLLRGKHDPEIDWDEVMSRLSARGYGHFVPGFLYLAERLFALPMPVPVTFRARRHYDWCLAQLKWPVLRPLVSFCGGLTHPFRRPPVEYVYGETCNALSLQINRLRYLCYLASVYRGGSLAKVSEVYRRLRRA
jgi:Uncharacterised nucleotidyltransferase